MGQEYTTAAVRRYLDALAGDQPAELIVRALPKTVQRRLNGVLVRITMELKDQLPG